MGHKSNLDRFLEKFYVAENGCWIWSAGIKGGGYGAFWMNGKLRSAHRVSMALYKNYQLSEKSIVMHACDNPSCVNPEHLSIGTLSQNTQDMLSKGRERYLIMTGEANPNAKLKNSQIINIIAFECLGFKRSITATVFSVTSSRIGQIIRSNK